MSFFIPRRMQVYARFIYYGSRVRFSVTLLALLLLSSSWYLTVYQRLEAKIDKTEQELYTFYNEYKSAFQKKQMQTNLEATLESLKHCAKSCKTYSNCSDCVRMHMNFLLNTIQKNGLALTVYSIGKEQDKGWFTRTKANLEISGALQQMQQLLKIIKNSGTMVQCKRMTITHLQNNTFSMTCQLNLIALK